MEGAAQISGVLNSAKLPRWSSPRLQKTRRSVARSTQAVAVGSTGELGWSTDLSQFYKLENMIGAGSYGIVRAAEHLHTGQKVAVKVLKKKRGNQARAKILRKLAREIDLLTKLQDSCNVVQLLTVFEDEDYAYLVCELCRGGDLERILMERGPFSERAAARVVYEALKMVAACHTNNVIHGDVKPANFLLRQLYKDPVAYLEGGNLSGAWMKSVDFGCSQVVRAEERLTRRTGTPVYMAPEIFERNYGLEADLWSVGMMFYQLVASRFPFWTSLEECRNKSVGEVMHTVLHGDIPLDYGPWLHMSPEGLDLMCRLTHRVPALRISAASALEHAWFKRQLHSAPPAVRHKGAQKSNIIPKTPKVRVQQPAPRQQDPSLEQEHLTSSGSALGSSMGTWRPELCPALVPL